MSRTLKAGTPYVFRLNRDAMLLRFAVAGEDYQPLDYVEAYWVGSEVRAKIEVEFKMGNGATAWTLVELAQLAHQQHERWRSQGCAFVPRVFEDGGVTFQVYDRLAWPIAEFGVCNVEATS